jgi:hypothetical protein
MGVSLSSLNGKIKRPVRAATVCLDGDLWARHDELTAQLDAIHTAQGRGKMGESAEARAVAEELTAVEKAMRASEVTIEFRGISSYQLAQIQARFPAKDGRGWDVNEGAHARIAACAVEPTTEEEAKNVLGQVNYAVSDKLFTAAWEATTGSSTVPTSARASALINASA